MHSKIGKTTINNYSVFQSDQNRSASSKPYQKLIEQSKHKQLLETLALVEDDIRKQGINIDLNDARKLQQKKFGVDPTKHALQENLPTDPDEDLRNSKNRDSKDKEYMAEQIEIFEAKIKSKKGQSQPFNVIPRDNKNIKQRFYGENSSPGHVYYPKHENIQKKQLSNVRMVLESNSRRVDEKPRAECMAVDSQHTCSYKARSVLRNAKRD